MTLNVFCILSIFLFPIFVVAPIILFVMPGLAWVTFICIYGSLTERYNGKWHSIYTKLALKSNYISDFKIKIYAIESSIAYNAVRGKDTKDTEWWDFAKKYSIGLKWKTDFSVLYCSHSHPKILIDTLGVVKEYLSSEVRSCLEEFGDFSFSKELSYVENTESENLNIKRVFELLCKLEDWFSDKISEVRGKYDWRAYPTIGHTFENRHWSAKIKKKDSDIAGTSLADSNSNSLKSCQTIFKIFAGIFAVILILSFVNFLISIAFREPENLPQKLGRESITSDGKFNRFSAFSLSESTGKYGVSWNYENSENAQRRAVQECGVADCRSVFLFRDPFGALAQATDTWVGGSANTQAKAEQIALQECERISRSPETCKITLVVNSSHGILTRNSQSLTERQFDINPQPNKRHNSRNSLQPDLTENSKVAINGIGPIRIGMTVDKASQSAGVRLVQMQSGGESHDCYYYQPDSGLSDVRFMVTQGHISRVDIYNKQVTTFSGAKIGDSEKRIMSLYPGRIQVQPHEYVRGGHYLIFIPKDQSDQSYRVVFETDGNRVTNFRSGKIPEVLAVEGCL